MVRVTGGVVSACIEGILLDRSFGMYVMLAYGLVSILALKHHLSSNLVASVHCPFFISRRFECKLRYI